MEVLVVRPEEVTVAKEEELNLGRATGFEKGRLKRLRQRDDAWEADFRALPKPITQSRTDYLGLVVTRPGGEVLAEAWVEGRPSGNDLAALLARAMRHPPAGPGLRPRHVHVRGHHQWRPLFPHLEELGIGVSVRQEMPGIEAAYAAHLRGLRAARRVGMTKPSAEQARVEQLFPAIARWVSGYGHVEIGDQEGFGFVVRALGHGGLVFEDDKPDTLAEALAALEKGLAEHFEREGIE